MYNCGEKLIERAAVPRHPQQNLRGQRPHHLRRAVGQRRTQRHPASLRRHVAQKLEGLGVVPCLSLGGNDRFLLRDLSEGYGAVDRRIDAYAKQVDRRMAVWEAQLRVLTTVTGIDRPSASIILIGFGPDISGFRSGGCLSA